MVVHFREVSFQSGLFGHLDNNQNLQHTGIILESSIGWEGEEKNSTSATSQILQEAEQQKAFTKEASGKKRATKRLADRASWRCCGLQTHPTPKLLASSHVFFCHEPGITHLPRDSTQLMAHSPTVASHTAGNTVPKEHSAYLNIYSEKCVSVAVKRHSQQRGSNKKIKEK